MYESAKNSRNRYVKKLGFASTVLDPRVCRPPAYPKLTRGRAVPRPRYPHTKSHKRSFSNSSRSGQGSRNRNYTIKADHLSMPDSLTLWLDELMCRRVFFANYSTDYGTLSLWSYKLSCVHQLLWINQGISSSTQGNIFCVIYKQRRKEGTSKQLDFLVRLVRGDTLNLSESRVSCTSPSFWSCSSPVCSADIMAAGGSSVIPRSLVPPEMGPKEKQLSRSASAHDIWRDDLWKGRTSPTHTKLPK